MNNLKDFIDSFINSKERNLQLDIFRENKQVLFQLYKQYDVNRWEIRYDSIDLDSSVLELRFNREKTSNKKNKERFETSEAIKNFDLVEKDTYFRRFDSDMDAEEIENEIIHLLKVVYEYNGQLIYTLNAY